jgi:hypothetical protein
MEMKNVLDQLKQIAETNDSEDVAAAIEQVDAYSFKERLKEAEKKADKDYDGDGEIESGTDEYKGSRDKAIKKAVKEGESASIYDQGDIDDFFGGEDETTVDKVKETEDEGEEEVAAADDEEVAADDEGGEEALDIGDPNHGGGGDAFDRIHDRVEARGGVHDTDPWGLGDDESEVEETPGDDDSYCAACGNTGKDLANTGQPCPNCHDDSSAGGSALDRVQDRAHRSGEGGPVDRVRDRHDERFAMIDEEMGRIFQTPMERHSWMMNELNKMAAEMDPEDAAMVKQLMKKAGEADVKGGNC